MDLLDLLLDHDDWATRELLAFCAELPEAQLDQPFDIGHKTIRDTFEHIIGAVPFWTAFLAGQPAPATAGTGDDRSLAGLRAAHERGYAAFAEIARRLRDEGRLAEIYVDHYDVRKSFGGTILMVIEHAAEHRAEIVHMLARLGVPEPPEVDLGVWDYLLHNS